MNEELELSLSLESLESDEESEDEDELEEELLLELEDELEEEDEEELDDDDELEEELLLELDDELEEDEDVLSLVGGMGGPTGMGVSPGSSGGATCWPLLELELEDELDEDVRSTVVGIGGPTGMGAPPMGGPCGIGSRTGIRIVTSTWPGVSCVGVVGSFGPTLVVGVPPPGGPEVCIVASQDPGVCGGEVGVCVCAGTSGLSVTGSVGVAVLAVGEVGVAAVLPLRASRTAAPPAIKIPAITSAIVSGLAGEDTGVRFVAAPGEVVGGVVGAVGFVG
jgi:hypothetical protein